MPSDTVLAYLSDASDDELELYATLARLFEILDRLGPGYRETTAEVVYQWVNKSRDMRVWRDAVRDWD